MIGYLTNKATVQKLFRISDRRMTRADLMIQKYGFWTASLSFVPMIGEALLVALGVMRVDKYKVIAVMAFGKFVRYVLVVASYYGVLNLF